MIKRIVIMFCFVSIVSMGAPLVAAVHPWPAPKEEPRSELWTVEANGRVLDVLTARTAEHPLEKYNYGGQYAFVSVDTDEPLTFKITRKSNCSLKNLVVRPLSAKVQTKSLDEHSFEFTVDRPCKLSIEPDGRNNPLLIFVNPLEKNIPKADDPNVIWFGPGVHKPKELVVNLKSNQTLYLAPGAILYAAILATGDHINIRGRGLIESGQWAWHKGPIGHVVAIRDSKDVHVEGVMIRGASRWTVVPYNCEDVLIDNIKICGGRVMNDDGINPCNSRRVAIRNCFIRSDDDCIAVKGLENEYGDCEDITVENCVFWCDRARIVLLGHESRAAYMRRILFRNCDVIHSQERNFVFEPGEKMKLEEVLFENIRIENSTTNSLDATKVETENGKKVPLKPHSLFVIRPAVNKWMRTKLPGEIRDITLRDITVTGTPIDREVLISGFDAEHMTNLVVFENIVVNGTTLNAQSKCVKIGDFADSVRFVDSKPDTQGFRSIFNGKSTEGWHGDPGYVFRDGALVLTKGTKKHYFADPLYSNFILKLDYRFDKGGNSGIALRSPSTQKDEPAYVALEIQILDDLDPSHFKAKPWQHNGSIYGIVPSKDGFLKPAGQWNSYEITVKDYQVTVRLNDTVIADANLEQMGFIRIVPKPGETLKRLLGHVGFTGHGDADIEFKNLRIKVLD